MRMQKVSRRHVMEKSKSKMKRPLLHLSLFDWRVAMGIGLLFGIVIGTAPQMIGTLLLLGLILGTITMVNRGRI